MKKTKAKATAKTKKLSPLAADIVHSFQAFQAEREGKITLRRTEIKLPDPVSVPAAFVTALRKQMNLSRAVFARKLHVPARTVENWEQGRTAVSGANAILVMLAAKYPDTLQRIELAVQDGEREAMA